MLQEVKNKFVELFSSTPKIFRSPGRINIIGEHTDYNEGFVLPAAIDKEIYFAVNPNNLGMFRFYSLNFAEYGEYSEVRVQTAKRWTNYLLGVIAQIEKRGIKIDGVDVVVGGTIPMGSGMSSSAAMECGFAFALNSIFDLGLSRLEMVKLSQIAEHEYAGLQCGIMDQFAVMFGKKDNVIQLDCKSLDYEYFSLNLLDYTILLCNSNVKHEFDASSEYNIRRREAEAGVTIVASHYPNIHTLRDVSMEQLQACMAEMTGKSYERCRYVIEENIRLKTACTAMLSGDVKKVGEMMYATHEGLSKQYEVSCPELDILVDIAHSCEGVVGSRMMGGGFGGCSISIVHKDAIKEFKNKIVKNYYEKYSKQESIFEVVISEGTSEIE